MAREGGMHWAATHMSAHVPPGVGRGVFPVVAGPVGADPPLTHPAILRDKNGHPGLAVWLGKQK